MNDQVAYILVSVAISVMFSQTIYAWFAKTIGEVTFAAHGIELWEKKETLIKVADDNDDMQGAKDLALKMDALTHAQNEAGRASEKITRCNLAIFVFFCFRVTTVCILKADVLITLSNGAEIWLTISGLLFIYGTYFFWSYFGQRCKRIDSQSR